MADPPSAETTLRRFWVRRRADLFGIGTIVGLILAFLAPGMYDGGSVGGFDLDVGRESSLGYGAYHLVHSVANGDAVSQMVSWNALDWQLIHQGHFPLWNEFSALGMPQFLNFESSVLSLPDLVSYAFPLRYAFFVVVAMKYLIAATRMYALCRTLRLRPSSSTFAAVCFMFSGAFAGWITWPLSDVACWTGWICAFALLAYREPHGYRYVVPLAIAVAFSIYGGFPEANVMVAMALGCAVAASGIALLCWRRHLSLVGIAHDAIGAGAGIGLAAPLWFAGQQIINVAHRQYDGHYVGNPIRMLALLFAQGYYGLPTGAHASFSVLHWNYYETVAYVGVIALVLALVAIVASRRHVVIIGLVVALLFSLVATYQPSAAFHPFLSLTNHLGQLSTIRFERMRIVTAFLIALLAGIGIDTLTTRLWSLRVRRVYALASVLGAVAIGVLWLASIDAHLSGTTRTQQFDSLIWPSVLAGLGVVVAAMLFVRRDLNEAWRRRGAFGVFAVLFGAQASFLFFAGVGIPAYTNEFYPTTPAIAQLESIVGTKLVAFDTGNSPANQSTVIEYTHIGFYPNVNLGYGVHEFAIHDPLIPAAYFTSWPVTAALHTRGVGLFVPDVNTAALARRYGITYLIAHPGTPTPAGTKKVATIAGEELFFVPGSSQFSFTGDTDANTNGNKVTKVLDHGNGSWTIDVHVTRPATLILRVTALPGWHLDGPHGALTLSTYDGVMQSASLPKGTYTLSFHYFPTRLRLGIDAALVAGVILVIWVGGFALLTARRRRRALTAVSADAPIDAPRDTAVDR